MKNVISHVRFVEAAKRAPSRMADVSISGSHSPSNIKRRIARSLTKLVSLGQSSDFNDLLPTFEEKPPPQPLTESEKYFQQLKTLSEEMHGRFGSPHLDSTDKNQKANWQTIANELVLLHSKSAVERYH